MRATLTILLLFLGACYDGAGEESNREKFLLPAAMQIGLSVSGSQGFVAVEDGTQVMLSPGSQGGYHVWTVPRFRGATGTLYLDRYARRVSDGALMLRASRLVIEVPSDALSDWWRDEQAIPNFMCPAPVGLSVFDTEVEFTYELFDEDERLLATDTLILSPRCPSGEEGDSCRSTCSGN